MADIPTFDQFKKTSGSIPSFDDFKAQQAVPGPPAGLPQIPRALQGKPTMRDAAAASTPGPSGLEESIAGAKQMAQPGFDNKAGGASRIVRAIGSAALPLAVPAAMTAPLAAGGAASLGYLGGKGARVLAERFGAGPGVQDLAEDAGGAVGGAAGGKMGGMASRAGTSLAKATLNVPRESAEMALQETRGVRPETLAKSAGNRINQAARERDAAMASPLRNPSLSPARNLLSGDIQKIQAGNGDIGGHQPMLDQLTKPKPGFTGALTPNLTEIHPEQSPQDFLRLRQQFGEDHTKFDQTKPLSQAQGIFKSGNKAYMGLTNELHSAVPGAAPADEMMSRLIPVQKSAQMLAKRDTGPMDTLVNRATRPTGAMVPLLFGAEKAGIPGMAEVAALQEALANPTARMLAARSLYGAGKPLSPTPAALIGTPRRKDQ